MGLNNELREDLPTSDGVFVVTHSETSKRGIVGESLDTHRLCGFYLDDHNITRLEELELVFDGLTGTAIDLHKARRICRRCGQYGNQALECSRREPGQGGRE